MPFIPNTPESLIGRSDSKNPETTCRGITSNGRPCRRPLASTPGGSPTASPAAPQALSSRVARLRVDDPRDPELYCWQHRDQASSSARSSPGPRLGNTPILERTDSIDSLIGRLGIVEAERSKRDKSRHVAPTEKPGHIDDVPDASNAGNSQSPKRKPKPKAQKRVVFCCCFTLPVVEEQRPARPQPKPVQSTPAKPASAKIPSKQHLTAPSTSSRPSDSGLRQSSAQSNISQRSQYHDLIPATASIDTALELLKEIRKPISQQDEPGYIYIFWLTPESQPGMPSAEVARNLLAPPSRPDARQRRTSDVLETFATKATKAAGGDNSSSGKKKILLKIGRTTNVQRRLNEWTRQCGYNLSLIRYYPYASAASQTPSTPRMVPHTHKVERLIHIELGGLGLRVADKASCDACGKAHREWFEVDPNRAAIDVVDKVIKRWTDWDEAGGQVRGPGT